MVEREAREEGWVDTEARTFGQEEAGGKGTRKACASVAKRRGTRSRTRGRVGWWRRRGCAEARMVVMMLLAGGVLVVSLLLGISSRRRLNRLL